MDNNRYCVIMAGGVGSRLWPLSRKNLPKQFHDLLGCGRTMLQQTYDRYSRIVPRENIIVSTNIIYSQIVHEQLPQLSTEQILHEPSFRGTAPSIAYAACHIRQLNPNANIVVAQSDQLVLKEDLFVETVGKGLDFVAEQSKLVIIGIKPTCPRLATDIFRWPTIIRHRQMALSTRCAHLPKNPNMSLHVSLWRVASSIGTRVYISGMYRR